MIISEERHIELTKAFNSVKNVYDWKAPIDSIITPDQKKLVADAIQFFTATKAKFEPFSTDMLRVTADGYRRGPAGDH